MKKILIVGVLFAGMAGCSEPVPQDQWVTNKTEMKNVPGFEDCVIAVMKTNTNSNPLVVIRCPNSSVNAQQRSGKTTYNQVSVTEVTTAVDHRVAQLEQQIREQDELIRKQQESLRTSLTLIKKEGN